MGRNARLALPGVAALTAALGTTGPGAFAAASRDRITQIDVADGDAYPGLTSYECEGDGRADPESRNRGPNAGTHAALIVPKRRPEVSTDRDGVGGGVAGNEQTRREI